MHRNHIDTGDPSFHFILGAILGDGDIHERQARFRTMSPNFAKTFLKHCKKIEVEAIKKEKIVRKRKYFTIRISSKMFCETIKKTLKENNFMSINFINAFMDADGTVYFKGYFKGVCIYNTNLETMEKISFFLNDINIKHSFRKYKQKPYAIFFGKKHRRKKRFIYVIRIILEKENILKFIKQFKFSIKKKQRILKKIEKYYLNRPKKILVCKCGKKAFYTMLGLCKECYDIKNKKKFQEYAKKYYKKHRKRIIERTLKYYYEHKKN